MQVASAPRPPIYARVCTGLLSNLSFALCILCVVTTRLASSRWPHMEVALAMSLPIAVVSTAEVIPVATAQAPGGTEALAGPPKHSQQPFKGANTEKSCIHLS
jgi:hypothetical protein